jgi:hypothetical protein
MSLGTCCKIQLSLAMDQLYDILDDEQFIRYWEEHCERDYSLFATILQSIILDVRSLQHSALQLLELVRCDGIVPIYQSGIYDAGCYYAIHAFVWIFSTSFIMSICGLLMITFRSVILPISYTL